MLRNCQSRVDIHHFNKVKKQLEVGEELLRGVRSVLVQITGEFFAFSGAITILYREVVNLQDVVIVVIHAQGVIPLGCIEGQVAQEQAPDKWTQPFDLICDPVEG